MQITDKTSNLSLLEKLNSTIKNFIYYLCKALKNLAKQSLGSLISAYTGIKIYLFFKIDFRFGYFIYTNFISKYLK